MARMIPTVKENVLKKLHRHNVYFLKSKFNSMSKELNPKEYI